jgi:CRISPR-associated protein Cmr2
MSKKYIALTLGPIYKTIAATKKTRHLWGASYLFSYLMRESIKKLQAKDKSMKILVPYTDDVILSAKNGAGLFPDRLLVQSNTLTLLDLKTCTDEVLNLLAEKGGVAADELKQYLQVYTLECEIEDNINAILALQSYLDTLEQMPTYQRHDSLPLISFLDKLNGALFYSDAGHQHSFLSIADIATHDLEKQFPEIVKKIKKDLKEDEDQALMSALARDETTKDAIRNYHHYIAIVQADGDNIGKTIGKIGMDEKTMNDFSKNLFTFSSKALEEIKKYGGVPVYAGGDDLLFFAPLANATLDDCSTILHLIHKIDAIFEEHLGKNEAYTVSEENEGKTVKFRPTMSYGVSVSYYKFPLGESRENAGNLLFAKAKKEKNKNTLALSLQKHSHAGSEIDLLLDKNNKKLMTFLTEQLLKLSLDKEAEPILHSVAQIFSGQKAMLENLMMDKQNRKDRLSYFFKHNFNESNHKPYHKKDGFFETLQEALLLSVTDNGVINGLKLIEQVIDIQHFIHRKIKQ